MFQVLGNVARIWVGYIKKKEIEEGKKHWFGSLSKHILMFWYNQRIGLKVRFSISTIFVTLTNLLISLSSFKKNPHLMIRFLLILESEGKKETLM